MERSWKTTHQARRRASITTAITGIGSSAASGGTSRPGKEAVVRPGTGSGSKSTSAAGCNRVSAGSATSSLFCNANGVIDNTSFLRDEEGLTDIIENAFEHHYHQKQHQHPKTTTSAAAAITSGTGPTTITGSRLYSRAGRTPSSGSITGLDDDDDTTTISATNEYFQSERHTRRLPTKNATSSKRRRPLSSLLHILDTNNNNNTSSFSSSSKVSRLTFLLFMLAIIYLSIRNASQGMQNLGLTVPQATTILLGGNRAGMSRHQKSQYAKQLLERKKEVESQTKEIFTTIRNAPNVGVPIPSAYKNLAEVETPHTSTTNHTTSTSSILSASTTSSNLIPFFWHLPRSGGSTVRDLLTHCYGLTMATGQGKVPNDLSITVSFRFHTTSSTPLFFLKSMFYYLMEY